MIVGLETYMDEKKNDYWSEELEEYFWRPIMMGFACLFIVDVVNVVDDFFKFEVFAIEAGEFGLQLHVFLLQNIQNGFKRQVLLIKSFL